MHCKINIKVNSESPAMLDITNRFEIRVIIKFCNCIQVPPGADRFFHLPNSYEKHLFDLANSSHDSKEVC